MTGWRRFCLAGTAVLLLALPGCAPKTVPAAVTTPKHPDFLYPRPPDGAPAALTERVQRGWQFLQGGDLGDAEREFAAALKQTPSATSAETALAYVQLARKESSAAVKQFDQALGRDGRYVPALVGRGQALLDLGRQGEAIASFEAALVADPALTDLQARVDVLRFRATQDLLARAVAASEAGRLDEARGAYLQAIAASPDSAFLYRDLAGVERRAGAGEAALDHLRRSVALDPSDARAHLGLGELLEGQGDNVAALAAYEKARSLDASVVPATTLARVRDRVTALGLPPQYASIPTSVQVTRADLAALVGVRLEPLVARTPAQPVVITDIRGQWAERWITQVVRAGFMEAQANYQFSPEAPVRRGDLAIVVARVLNAIAAMRPEPARKWQAARLTVADVPSTHLSYPAVSMAAAAGVMPLDNGAFGLLRPVSGAEAADVIARLEQLAR
jgi:tetratricopeptide (TPR) repeat protein